MSLDPIALGKTIAGLRNELGLTQKELGEILGLTAEGLAHIESGRRVPSNETWKAIERAFGVPAEALYVLGRDNETAKKLNPGLAKLLKAAADTFMLEIRKKFSKK